MFAIGGGEDDGRLHIYFTKDLETLAVAEFYVQEDQVYFLVGIKKLNARFYAVQRGQHFNGWIDAEQHIF